MNSNIEKKHEENPVLMCLCFRCASTFYNIPGYHVKRHDYYQVEKDVCTFCNSRTGYDYEITRKSNVRKVNLSQNRTFAKGAHHG